LSTRSLSPAEVPAPVLGAAQLCLERKAHGVLVLDLRGLSTATDWFVVASGRSDVQVKAIADHVLEILAKDQDLEPGHVEGQRGGRWVLLDYIDFVVHVFHPHARDFYQLENLWGDAPRWDLPDEE